MNDYVVSKDIAERLRDANFPQTTQHVWTNFNYSGWVVAPSDDIYDHGEIGEAGTMAIEAWSYREELETRTADGDDPGDIIAAPLSDELLEALPEQIYNANGLPGIDHLRLAKNRAVYEVSYGIAVIFKSDRLPDALAQLWLYLHDHNLLPKTKEQI